MKFFAILLIACFAHDWDSEWNAWKTQHGKVYEASEDLKRFQIYMDNMALAESWNNDEGAQIYGATIFSDLTYAELQEQKMGYQANAPADLQKWDNTCFACKQFPNLSGATPKSIDWTALGAVNPIKDQAQCGSCWTFSTVAGMEGAVFMGTGKLPSLSEQEIVSCDFGGAGQGQGCNGGEMTQAYEWILSNGGLNSELMYPYTSGTGDTGKCNKEKAARSVASLDGAFYVSNSDDTDEMRMLNATAHVGPLSIAINARKLQTYQGGVMNPSICLHTLDHGVAVVGYGTDGGTDYWKIRNSWGRSWGEQGYFRIARGSNKCGLALDVSCGYKTSSQRFVKL